jgi:hypothetical protein
MGTSLLEMSKNSLYILLKKSFLIFGVLIYAYGRYSAVQIITPDCPHINKIISLLILASGLSFLMSFYLIYMKKKVFVISTLLGCTSGIIAFYYLSKIIQSPVVIYIFGLIGIFMILPILSFLYLYKLSKTKTEKYF